MSRIKLKAKKDAPEFVQVGNLSAENKDGYFHTDNRDFADALIADGYATEESGTKPAKPKRKTAAKAKPVVIGAKAVEKTVEQPVKTTTVIEEKSNEGESK